MNSFETSRPRISVVIASVNGPEHLGECLDALEQQSLRGQMEIVVADRCGDAVARLVQERHPAVRLLSLAGSKSVPELRAAAIREAHGQIVAITEDHCLAPADWCAQMLRAHQERNGIIGGAVENHPSLAGVMNWGAFFCEYARFMNPVPDGEAENIPGNNISYRREFLTHVSDLLEQGTFWEESLNARLREKGIHCYSDPKVVVFHKKGFRLGEFLSQRYHYSRSFAGIRVKDAAAWRKLAYAAFCPVLPALLMARIVGSAWRKHRHRDKLIQAVPLLLLFTAVWAWGELVGYLAGPGESLRKVE